MPRLLISGATVIGLALLSVGNPQHPLLVWNATASAPIGLYRVLAAQAVRHGDLVLAETPPTVARLAAERGYVPLHVPLVKRVAAMAGDRVCMQGDAVVIDHTVVALRVAQDNLGRPLPYWQGCRVLRRHDLFLLMRAAPHSFDSRYFGPVPTSSILGVLEPIWTR